MGMCQKCCKLVGVLVLLAGLYLAAVDLGMWPWMKLSWYTLAFLLVGLCKLGKAHCPDCNMCSTGKKK